LDDGDQIVEKEIVEKPVVKSDDPIKIDSKLMATKHMTPLVAAMKHLVPDQDLVKRMTTKKWQKLYSFASDDESTKESIKGVAGWKKMLGMSPTLVIQRFKNDDQKEIIQGIFYQGQMPELPNTMPYEEDEQAFSIKHETGDFAFVYGPGSDGKTYEYSHHVMSENWSFMNGRSLIEIFLTSEAFVLTYGTAFLVLCPDKNLESEFEHITEGIQQV
jgi:hypothetical protein